MTDSGNNPFDKQISNRNYLSPLGFKLVISKAPTLGKSEVLSSKISLIITMLSFLQQQEMGVKRVGEKITQRNIHVVMIM